MSSDDSIEIVTRDPTYKKTGTWKFKVREKSLARKIFGFLFKKYNLGKDGDDGEEWVELDVNW